MLLRSGRKLGDEKVEVYKKDKGCGHECDMWNIGGCCVCSDKRERTPNKLYAKYVDRVGNVYMNTRSANYCPKCKK